MRIMVLYNYRDAIISDIVAMKTVGVSTVSLLD